MLRIYSNENSILVNHMKNILINEGINCFIKNENTQGAGVAGIGICWPELWINDTEKAQQAETLINQNLDNSNLAEWLCESCGENNEGQFNFCWSCSQSKVELV